MVLKSMKAKTVMKAKQVMRIEKDGKPPKGPKTMKTKKLKTVMNTVNTKAKAKEFFRVVDFVRLGLGLKLGHCYTRSFLQKRCKGDRSKLNKLAKYMEDPRRLQLEWLVPNSSQQDVIVPPKPALKLFEVNQIVSKKGAIGKGIFVTQKTSGCGKAKRINSKVHMAGPMGASTRPFMKALAKTACKTNAIGIQTAAKCIRAKDEDESTLTQQRRDKLIKLPLEDLQVLHAANDLRTEPVKDFVKRVKARFMAKKVTTLQSMCEKRKLATSGNKATLANRLLGTEKHMLKTKMVEALLIFEADARKQEREQSANIRGEVIASKEKVRSANRKLRYQLGAKTHAALNAHLRDYGLKVSGTKSEKAERVLARMQAEGEAGKIVAARASKARKRELRSMHAALLMLECAKSDQILEDSHFKKMIIDRLVLAEGEGMATP
jgi:hypothetical protein